MPYRRGRARVGRRRRRTRREIVHGRTPCLRRVRNRTRRSPGSGGAEAPARSNVAGAQGEKVPRSAVGRGSAPTPAAASPPTRTPPAAPSGQDVHADATGAPSRLRWRWPPAPTPTVPRGPATRLSPRVQPRERAPCPSSAPPSRHGRRPKHTSLLRHADRGRPNRLLGCTTLPSRPCRRADANLPAPAPTPSTASAADTVGPSPTRRPTRPGRPSTPPPQHSARSHRRPGAPRPPRAPSCRPAPRPAADATHH